VQKEGFTPEDCLGEATVLYGKEVTVEELLPQLLEDREFYENSDGGVTLSGGECLMQADFCSELLKRLKEQGVHTAVDTCGFVPKGALDKVIPYTDVFLYDIKAYDVSVHIQCTGQSNKVILDNLLYLDSLEKKIEIRIPYVPDYNDDQMEKIARFLAPLRHITKIRVLPYHNYAGSKYKALNLRNTLPEKIPTDDEIQKAKEIIKSITNFVVIS
jgi:pyruvate formate lyase activating enzyme